MYQFFYSFPITRIIISYNYCFYGTIILIGFCWKLIFRIDITPRHLPVRFTPYKIFTASEQKGKGRTSVLTLNASRCTLYNTITQRDGKGWIENSYTAKLKKNKRYSILIKSFLDGLPSENWQLQHQTSAHSNSCLRLSFEGILENISCFDKNIGFCAHIIFSCIKTYYFVNKI